MGQRAQTLIEYILLITIVVAAMVTMFPRVKRSTQSVIKAAADQIGDQKGAEQDFDVLSSSGHLESSYSRATSDKTVRRRDVNGNVSVLESERVDAVSNAFMNYGFSER